MSSGSRPAIGGDHTTRIFRLSWIILVAVGIALYLGWGAGRLWALLPLGPTFLLLRPAPDRSGGDPLGRWRWLVVLPAGLCALGFLLLPRQPSPDWLQRRETADRQRLAAAIEETGTVLTNATDRIARALTMEETAPPAATDLDALWPEVRSLVGTGAAAVTWLSGEYAGPVWAGSPWLVPVAAPPRRAEAGEESDTGRFTITGDSLAVVAVRTRPVGTGTLHLTVLLLRAADAPGPSPGDRPLLDLVLPRRLVHRLTVVPVPGAGEGRVEIVPGPAATGTLGYPLRTPAQVVLLLSILAGALVLLGRDSSALRGITAAPLIYISVVPMVVGAVDQPLTLALIAPSWSGHQLINQAFLAVSAAALALWFALTFSRRLADRRPTTATAILSGLPIVFLWPLGMALLGDLFRFAPSWFWARVSFLPGGRDLSGWLIAVAMTLAILAGSGGAARLLRARFGLPGLIGALLAAVVGAVGADLTGLWLGSIPVAVLAAGGGTLAAALWLDAARHRPMLTALLGIGTIGALVLLPLKSELGRMITRRVVADAAASLGSAGVGLEPGEIDALRRRVYDVARRHMGATPDQEPPDSDREAYLIWRELNLERENRAGGVQIVAGGGQVTGRFTTDASLFDLTVAEALRRSALGGQGRLALAAGEQSQFGEETLLMAAPVPGGGRALLTGVRPRPLGFVADDEARIWSLAANPGGAERAGRFGGELFVRVYDETFRLLAVPRNPRPAPAPSSVPTPVVQHLRESDEGIWYRRGWWLTGGADEYYFRLETARAGPSLSGVAVGEIGTVERVACLGMPRPGLWGRLIETLQILLIFLLGLLLLGWLPAAALARSGVPLSTSLSRVSFRTRLIIPLLVVALLPLAALWLLTRGFVLTRERAAWESSLEQNVRNVEQAVTEQTAARARELARDAEHVSSFGFTIPPDGTQWALFDENLVRLTGTLADSLADRIPLREVVLGRGPQSFLFRAGDLWSAALAPIGSRFSGGAALVVRPYNDELLRQAAARTPGHVDLFLDGRIAVSTDPAPFTAGVLPRVLPRSADWEGSQGREVGTFSWGSFGALNYLFAYRPLTDYSGIAVATLARRHFGLWGLNDPAVNRLFTTVASIYLLLVVAVTLVAVLAARMISQPIGELTGSARRVAGGDLDVEIPVTRGDEVGGLQKAFRQMVIALRENRDELARAERERAWQEMARQVAHEIKNPLTPMQLSAQFLRRAYDEGAEDIGRILHECTDTIVEQVEGLRRIANEFSTYARLPVVRRAPTDLNEPVEDALNLFEPARPEGITIIRELAPDLPEAPLDAEQIRRVAINLMRNALDAMGDEGELIIRTGADDTCVWLEVSDTGEGIAPEVQERLFEPYFSTKTEGMGLGLAITRAIVDAYDGEISVDSRPGVGTSVTVRFPFG